MFWNKLDFSLPFNLVFTIFHSASLILQQRHRQLTLNHPEIRQVEPVITAFHNPLKTGTAVCIVYKEMYVETIYSIRIELFPAKVESCNANTWRRDGCELVNGKQRESERSCPTHAADDFKFPLVCFAVYCSLQSAFPLFARSSGGRPEAG